MSDEEDDKPTIILDLDSVKKQLNNEVIDQSDVVDFGVTENDELSRVDISMSDIEQSVIDSDNTAATVVDIGKEKPIVLCFDHESTFFKDNFPQFPHTYEYIVISNVEALNQHLSDTKAKIIMLNFSANGKVANLVSKQIRNKFSHIKAIILANNLSDSKAQAHQKTDAGAAGYLSIPINTDKMVSVFTEVLGQ
jgi:hypothetical protein